MLQTETLPRLSAREARKQQRVFQKKKARMAASLISWLAFEKEISKDPDYSRVIHKTVARISGEVAYEKNANKIKIRWDEGRDRILTLDFLQSVETRFSKTHATIHRDVAKVASHASWLSGIYARGEGRILYDISLELKQCSDPGGLSGPQFAPPAPPPLILTAIEIKRSVEEANTNFKKAEKEFLGDEPPKLGTGTFSFLDDIDRRVRFTDKTKPVKKPRRNWRREI